MHRDLLEMGRPLDVHHVGEAHRRLTGHEQRAGLGGPLGPVGRRLPVDVAEHGREQLVGGVLDVGEQRQVVGAREPYGDALGPGLGSPELHGSEPAVPGSRGNPLSPGLVAIGHLRSVSGDGPGDARQSVPSSLCMAPSSSLHASRGWRAPHERSRREKSVAARVILRLSASSACTVPKSSVAA